MHRRSFLAGLAGTALAASVARAQQAPAPAAPAAPAAPLVLRPGAKKIAIASAILPTESMIEGNNGDLGMNAFLAELKAQGLVPGQDVAIERYSGSQWNTVRRLQGNRWNALGVTVANAKPDVLFTTSSYIARGAATNPDTAPQTVFLVGDAAGTGLVSNMQRPGGNMTGVSAANGAANNGMRIDLLKEAVPAAMRIAFLMKSQAISPTPYGQAQLAVARAQRQGVTVTPAFIDDLLDDAGIDATAHLRAVLEAQRAGAQGFVVADMLDLSEYTAMLGSYALATKMPAVGNTRDFVVNGGLASYGANYNDLFKSAAQLVARVVKGEKAGDIAIVQAQPELVVSQRNARNLGITVPQPFVAKAKEVLM